MLCQIYRIIFVRDKYLWHWSNLDIDSIHPNMTLARVWYAMLAVTIVCVLMHVCVCVCACVCVCVRERECVCVCGSRGATSHNIAWLSLEPRGHGVRGGLNLWRESKDLFSPRFFLYRLCLLSCRANGFVAALAIFLLVCDTDQCEETKNSK